MKIPFTKMHGTGNDFVIIDEFKRLMVPEKEKSAFVRRISDRHLGVGSDGVIFIQKSKKTDAKFHFFNPDGSRAEMCGNGIRCFAKYLLEHKLVRKRQMRVETPAGEVVPELSVSRGVVTSVKVDMGWPRIKRKDIPVAKNPNGTFIGQILKISGKRYKVTAVGMGNPHVVLFVRDVDGADVIGIGRKIRNHNLFPNGANVHFLQSTGTNKFRIRTYERGVEDETLACGTGICASAVAAVLNNKANPKKPITMAARGGTLKVELLMDGDEITKLYLAGAAEEVFSGFIEF